MLSNSPKGTHDFSKVRAAFAARRKPGGKTIERRSQIGLTAKGLARDADIRYIRIKSAGGDTPSISPFGSGRY